jgi:hypothetical protein
MRARGSLFFTASHNRTSSRSWGWIVKYDNRHYIPTRGSPYAGPECIAARKPVVVHAFLLRSGIEWLNDAYARGRMCEWSDPREVALTAASCGGAA